MFWFGREGIKNSYTSGEAGQKYISEDMGPNQMLSFSDVIYVYIHELEGRGGGIKSIIYASTHYNF